MKSSGFYSYANVEELEVAVPNKVFDSICVKTTIGDIAVKKDVKTVSTALKSTSGDIELTTTAKKTVAQTTNGDVDIVAHAEDDIVIVVQTKTGDVSVSLGNVKDVKFNASTKSGRTCCKHVDDGKYLASVVAQTTIGDVIVR